jgi:hypothetical protein
MTGPKLNEGALLIDETQVATKATARYLRGSASKARQVLDLIRGLDVRRADEVLQFTDRAAAQDLGNAPPEPLKLALALGLLVDLLVLARALRVVLLQLRRGAALIRHGDLLSCGSRH